MVKKVVLSAKKKHYLVKELKERLNKEESIELISHDPTKDFFDLKNMAKIFSDIDLLVVKVRNQCSIDLLHYAKIHNIPTLHDIDSVLICKNKVALDQKIRNILHKITEKNCIKKVGA